MFIWSLVACKKPPCSTTQTKSRRLFLPWVAISVVVFATILTKIIPEEEVLKFLASRQKTLDAVVITGGEPTLQADLPAFIQKVKALGYLVKLDTNGTHPDILAVLIDSGLLDYIAMDIKGPLPKYDKIVRVNIATENIQKSIALIMASGLPYEFRSTILPALHSSEDLSAMSQLIAGADRYFLQKFMPTDSLNDPTFGALKSFTDEEMLALAELCARQVKYCAVR